MICGKGGCGKTSITVLAAETLASHGYTVDVVDSDESNPSLHRFLGLSQPKPLIEYLGGRKRVADLMRGGREADLAEALKVEGRLSIGSLPAAYVALKPEGIRLVVAGKISDFFEGCACPLNFLTRVFLSHLHLGENEVVLIDTDAGIEHLGRGLEEAVDTILCIVDPSFDSILLAEKMFREAGKLGKEVWAVVNRTLPEAESLLMEGLTKHGIRVAGRISFDMELFKSNLAGGPLKASTARAEVKEVLNKIGFRL